MVSLVLITAVRVRGHHRRLIAAECNICGSVVRLPRHSPIVSVVALAIALRTWLLVDLGPGTYPVEVPVAEPRSVEAEFTCSSRLSCPECRPDVVYSAAGRGPQVASWACGALVGLALPLAARCCRAVAWAGVPRAAVLMREALSFEAPLREVAAVPAPRSGPVTAAEWRRRRAAALA